jgi:hypothetical protein
MPPVPTVIFFPPVPTKEMNDAYIAEVFRATDDGAAALEAHFQAYAAMRAVAPAVPSEHKSMSADVERELAAIAAALGSHPAEAGGSAQILEAVKVLQKDPGDGIPMHRAETELPDGFELHVCLKAGACRVELYGPDGQRIELTEVTGACMAQRINAAIAAALAARGALGVDDEFGESRLQVHEEQASTDERRRERCSEPRNRPAVQRNT